MKLLKNKNVFITGGTSFIGRKIIEIFLNHGANIIFTFYKSKKIVDNIINKFKCYSNKIFYIQLDLSNENEIINKMNNISNKLINISVLINNVGITKDKLLINMDNKTWKKIINVNLSSMFYITKYISKYMIINRFGSIINIGSVISELGNVGQINYSTSKSAIIGFTKSLSKELGKKNIRCNTVLPGIIKSPLINNIKNIKYIKYLIDNIPLNRLGSSLDVANICLFLASDFSSYISGESIKVSGGL